MKSTKSVVSLRDDHTQTKLTKNKTTIKENHPGKKVPCFRAYLKPGMKIYSFLHKHKQGFYVREAQGLQAVNKSEDFSLYIYITEEYCG